MPAPLIESDSSGKTITTLLIGVLATKYNLSLDSTLESHGPTGGLGTRDTYLLLVLEWCGFLGALCPMTTHSSFIGVTIGVNNGISLWCNAFGTI